jgi:hypothetical protein
MKRLIAVLLMTLPAWGQTAATSATTPSDPWKSLNFLEGTWGASTDEKSGVSSSGTYTFRRELGGHVIARRSTAEAGCKGPATFDCEHGDVLYVYRDAPMPGMKAIYFDNEGHVIHYDVSTPSATKVVFLSEQGRPGPAVPPDL